MERISHYRLVATLGRGAMGEVWRAVDERLGRPVALKLLPKARAGQTNMQARLLREAQAASALNHPGIVTVHDVGAWHGQIFMVMELVDGEPLSELARRGIPVAEALRLVADAADAMATAHQREILHRDIKCDNLMRTRDGRLKVLDFGLAKLRAQPATDEPSSPGTSPGVHGVADLAAVAETLDSTSQSGDTTKSPTDPNALEALHGAEHHAFPPLSSPSTPSESLTMAGALVGTPVYMAPEQTDGTPGDAQSEVWSLGVVLYELLTGKRPFDRATIPEVLEAIRSQPIVPPSQLAHERSIPSAADAVVMKALARDRRARFADMHAFAVALRQARRRVGGGFTGNETALAGGGRRVLLGAAAAAALLVAVAGYAYFRRAPRSNDPPGPSVTVTGTRRISFDSGCEEYPSFLPDGHTLVYDGLADGDYELLALDLDSGARRRLTHAGGWDYGGAVSPDGKSIAYVHLSDTGREIRVLPVAGDGAGAPRTLGLSAIGFPAWSRDGAVLVGDADRVVRWTLGAEKSVIAELPSGSAARYVAELRGGGLVALWQTSHASNELALGEIPVGGKPRVVETGLTLDTIGTLAAPTTGGYYYGRHHATANELIRRQLGGRADVVPGGITPVAGMSLSADGKRLAYSTCRESGVLARLRPGKPPEELLPRGTWRDVWPAPVDERRIVFQSDRAGAIQVWMLDVQTRETRPLAPTVSSHPAVSPDGKWIAYAGGTEPGIHVAPVDGGQATRVTDDPTDAEPQFAFDGKTLVFERTRTAEGARVYGVAIGGGAVRPLSPVGALSPAASPTEDRVVFVLPGAHGRVVMSTTLVGRAATPLSARLAPGDWLNPRFSRDGKKLLVVHKTAEVVEVDVAGGESRVVYKAAVEGIGEVNWAADGDGLIASVQLWDGDLWLAEGNFP
jgi:serine/threonine protein kinase/Tol biopolymer transport system component